MKLGNANTDDLNPWDFGVYFLSGYQLENGINFGLNYSLGLSKADTDKSEEQQREIRYYLHLPKIAYTLARLPSQVRNNENFAPVRTSLKNPYNAPYFRAIATWLELLNR